MLDMPTKFIDDVIESANRTNLIPLVSIEGRDLYFSTNTLNSFQIGFNNSNKRDYLAAVNNISGLDSEIDLAENSFNISNVTIDLFDLDGKINSFTNFSNLSDIIFSKQIVNEKVEIYLKSQSARHLEDCLLVYTGYVKSIQQKQNMITIEVEDNTEKIFDKDFINEFVRDDIGLPQRYHNLPVPVVYGTVDKAPCVYYDLYSSLLLTRNRDYALTPDSFAIQEITNPLILADSAYMTIRENATLFESKCSNTLYREFIPKQYEIVGGNRIIMSKSPDAAVTEDFENQLIGMRATTTGFGFVEVEQTSSPTLIDSKYVLHYQEEGFPKKYAIADIAAYDFNDQLVQGKEFGTYADKIKIKDWGSYEGTGLFPAEEWYWGSNLSDLSGYTQLYGESFINFELQPFASDSNIVSEFLKDNDGNTKKVKSEISITFSIDAQIQNVADDYPELYFQWTDSSVEIWDMDYNDNDPYPNQSSETDPYLVQSGLRTFSLDVNSVAANNFTIGQRSHTTNDDEEFTGFELDPQGGIIKHLKINSMAVTKVAILNNFLNYDIYANVRGRVDDVQGTYTGIQTLRFEQEGVTYEPTTRETRISQRPSIKAPDRTIKKPVTDIKSSSNIQLVNPKIAKIERGRY